MSGAPRDFLDQASNYLKTPTPLSEMYAQDGAYVTNKLLDILRNGGIMERKYAAFALGQIGDEETLGALQSAQHQETKEGVLDAIAAAISGIEEAGLQKGSSEIERRRIIQDVYESRSPFVSKESPVNEPSPIWTAHQDTELSACFLGESANPVGILVCHPYSPSASVSKSGCFSLIAVIGLWALLVSLILMILK